jgi:threonine/homoserine/homoserine lactone efflux protein
MIWSAWLAFAAAAVVMGVVPGPGVVSIVGYAIGAGRRTALAATAGMAVGNALAMSLSLLGVGALLSASALAFAILKWAGAVYLVGLGLRTSATAQPRSTSASSAASAATPRRAFLHTVVVGVLHPKTIAFFVAFVPQFIIRARAIGPRRRF